MQCSECGDDCRQNRFGTCKPCRLNMKCTSCGTSIKGQGKTRLCRDCSASNNITARNKMGWSEDQRAKGSGPNHYNWKGDEAGYIALHDRVRKARGWANKHDCFFCITKKADEWARLKGTSGLEPVHYVPACYLCHNRYDYHWDDKTRAKVSESLKQAYAEGRR